MALTLSKRRGTLAIAGAILLSIAILVVFYVRTQGDDESGYFRDVATMRQLKQLDTRWELDVMKSRIGIDENYDALVHPLFDLGQLQQELSIVTASGPGGTTEPLAAADRAIGDAIRQKMTLIERFKSHNAVLRNSLAFLPTADADVRGAMLQRSGARAGNVSRAADAVLLATLVYSQAPSQQLAENLAQRLARLETLGGTLPQGASQTVAIFIAHIRVVLREQPAVNGLLGDITDVPTNARIDAFDRLLSGEHEISRQRVERARKFLLCFAAAMVALLLFAAVKLLQGHAEINRINRALGEANAGLEQRVGERTQALLASNMELRQSETRLALQASELADARDAAQGANEAKSVFLATMSHELRTPLNAIIGFTELMQASLFGPIGHPKYAEYIDDINRSGSHLLALINDILDLSRLDAGRADLVDEAFSPAQLIRDVCRFLEPLARHGGLTIATDLAPALPKLRADLRRVKQVLLNLLSNAIKFTPAGGTVTIRADEDHGRIQLVVCDTGIGMSKDDLPRALERFGQVDTRLARKYEGTGLGLPLAKQLVELHDGTFDISSAPGVGTTVALVFPADRTVRDVLVVETARALRPLTLAVAR